MFLAIAQIYDLRFPIDEPIPRTQPLVNRISSIAIFFGFEPVEFGFNNQPWL